MSTQAYSPQAGSSQATITSDALDFSFWSSQSPTSGALSDTDLLNNFELSDISNFELDEQFMATCSNLTAEGLQQMIDSFSASSATPYQDIQPVPLEASNFQQEVPPQAYDPATNILPQPSTIVPSQAPITSQDAAPEQLEPASVVSSSETPSETTTLNSVTLLMLNQRFNPTFRKMGIVSCPDKIDLKAGMEQEDAMVAAGYLPQTHVPWEQALQLLGKQGFRTYYYSEVKKAKANNIELPPVPVWITRYCYAKDVQKKPAGPSKKVPAANSLSNKHLAAKVLLARNNPTRKSKASAISQKNKGKGKAVATQRYTPHTPYAPYARQ
ncbi:unnamed protein product [Rhizoctonia solani]|uniref:Uncharacterized protein n=1 Tax=Rhizoctonia solani TaxID=456999 RepID=A0A8H3E799_9AGAM|nr:unnamed protein product [Rhizoctonia solani]